MSGLIAPTWSDGLSRAWRAGDAQHPHLWAGLLDYRAPGLGVTGAMLHDPTGRRPAGAFGSALDPATDWVTGARGPHIHYGGVANEYVDLGPMAAYGLTSQSPLTLTAWVRSASTSVSGIIMGAMGTTVWEWGLYHYGSGAADEFLGVLGTAFPTTGKTFGTEWRHVAMTSSGGAAANGRVKLYFDGRLVATASGGNATDSAGEVAIGRRGVVNSHYFSGDIGNTSIHNRPLAAAEILQLYQDYWAVLWPRRRLLPVGLPRAIHGATAVRAYAAAVALIPLRLQRTIPGIAPLSALARNGPGVGRLRSIAGNLLDWRAPGDATYGTPVDVSRGGEFGLGSGTDSDAAFRISVSPEHLLGSTSEADVTLTDRFNTGLADADISAAEATAGDVSVSQIALQNDSGAPITSLVVWLDAATDDLEISDDNITYVTPTTEVGGLDLGGLLPNEPVPLYIRRTILAAAPPATSVLNLLHYSYTLDGSTYQADLRGRYRIFAATEYRFYRSNSAPPDESDTPFATSSTLPHEPADTYADGTWYLSVRYFNGLYDSGFLPVGPQGETYLRLELTSGAATGDRPPAPINVQLVATTGGVISITAISVPISAIAPEEWAIGYTLDGTDPAADDPTTTVAITSSLMAILMTTLAAQADGTIVKVRVQTRRSNGAGGWIYSADSTVLTITADSVGPAAVAIAT